MSTKKGKGKETTGSPARSKVKIDNRVEEVKDLSGGSSKRYEIEIEQNQNVSLVENIVILSE